MYVNVFGNICIHRGRKPYSVRTYIRRISAGWCVVEDAAIDDDFSPSALQTDGIEKSKFIIDYVDYHALSMSKKTSVYCAADERKIIIESAYHTRTIRLISARFLDGRNICFASSLCASPVIPVAHLYTYICT